MRWLANHRSDPSTKMALKKRHLAPNLALRSAIEGWVASESATRCAQPLPQQANRTLNPASGLSLVQSANLLFNDTIHSACVEGDVRLVVRGSTLGSLTPVAILST